MLSLSKISKITPYSPEWFAHRRGYMTGSKISCICAPKGIGDGGMTYIRNKVSERITGVSTEKNVNTEGTQWGVINEPIAVKEYQDTFQIPMIITDKHIVFDDLYSVTPDGLLITNEKLIYDESGENLNCETLESKSYMTPSVHMEHIECQTAEEIKKINAPLFWQVVSQIHFANVTRGRAVFFHPDFPKTSKYRIGHVLFKKLELLSDFKLFATRLEEARTIYNEKLKFSQSL